jgi:hypothetical protein
MMKVMGYMKYDTWELGNHEFNFGLETLNRIMTDAQKEGITVLGANIHKTSDESSFVKPYVIKDFVVNGKTIKVGILGMITKTVPSWEDTAHYAGLKFNDLVDDAKVWVPKMKEIQAEFEKLRIDGEKINVLGSVGQGRLVTQLPFFDELGVKSTAALAQDFDNLLIEELEDVVENVGDFDVMVNTFQAAEQVHITKQTNPDLTMTCPFQGGAWKRDANVTRVHSLRGDANPWSAQSGYTGAVAFGNYLLQSLKNKSYQKTMQQKTGTAYKDWYLEQPDPLYFLEKGK